MPSTRVAPMPMLEEFSPSGTVGTARNYTTSAASRPSGANTMLFFAVCQYRRPITAQYQTIFQQTNGSNAGWAIAPGNTGLFRAYAKVTAGFLVATAPASLPYGLNVPYIVLAQLAYSAGPNESTLTLWMNGVQVASVGPVSGTFVSYAGSTWIGSADSNQYAATDFRVGDCGMLYSYNVTGYSSALYGSGAAGLTRHWWDDLKNGRYLTWPRAAAVGQDWHWAAADAVNGCFGDPTWTDRYTSCVMTRTGLVQGASVNPPPSL